MKILVTPVFPPIPTDSFNYRAIDGDTYDGELRDGEWVGGPQGFGATPQEAEDDLKAQLEAQS